MGTAKNGVDAPRHDSCGETPGVACKHVFFQKVGSEPIVINGVIIPINGFINW